MPTISASVAQHLNYRLAVGLSKGTVLNNQVALNSFVAVVGDMQCKSLKPEHFDKWFATRLSQVSPATTNQNFASIKVWVQWAQRYGHLSATVPYTAGVRRVHEPARDPLRVPVDQFPHLLDSAPDPLARMLVATGLYLFVRQSEAMTIRHCDVDLNGGSIHVRVWKTRQVDDMPICSELDDELRRYLRWYSQQVPVRPGNPLMPRRGGGHWVTGAYQRHAPTVLQPEKPLLHPHVIVQRTLRAAGIEIGKGEGCHTLRRSGARALYDALCEQGHDRSIRYVQRMLHHASIAMTERYIGLTADVAASNKALRGKPMFAYSASNVVSINKPQGDEETWPVAL